MSELSDQAAAAERRTRTSLAGEKLNPVLAKLYSQHVRLGTRQGPLISFSRIEFVERLGDAVTLVDGSLRARGRGEDGWRDGLRRSAEILEWLAHPDLKPEGIPLSLLSAAAYHLAGYPARASTLAAQSGHDEQDAPLLRLLLRSDFPALLELAADIAVSEPRRELEVGAGGDESLLRVQEFISSEVAAAMGILCAELRWGGQRRASRALAKLRAAASAMMPFADPYGWLVLRLVAEVADQALSQSLRGLVQPLEKTVDSDGRVALERYVRGAYTSRRILAWPSQARGLDRLTSGGSFALCTPTGSGKTTVAEIALLEGLFLNDADALGEAALCLYLVPTRALAAEVEGRLARALRGIGGRRAIAVTALYGGTDWGPTDASLSGDSPTVLVSTQEKAEALVRFLGPQVVDRIRLVVVDEAHEVQATARTEDDKEDQNYESRALRLETLIARLRARLGDRTRFIALSAVAQGIQGPLARWISGGENPEPIVLPYRSTRQVVGRLRCQAGGRTRIELDLLDGQRIELSDRAEGPYIPDPFASVPGSTGMTGPQKGLAPYALWAAMQLADDRTELGGQSVLISIAQGIAYWSGWLADLLDYWSKGDLPQFFSPPEKADERELWDRALRSCADYFGEASREFRLLKRGVVVHHGKMPGRLPQLLVRLVEIRVVRIVLATSTLSQGVNLPFQTVLVPGLARFGGAMTGRELSNLAGRAGRPGVATEGQTLVLILEGQKRWQAEKARGDYESALAEITGAGRSEGAVSAFASLIEEVSRLGPDTPSALEAWLESTAPLTLDEASGEESAIRALDSLDAVLIACLEEAGSSTPAAAEAAVRTMWRQTFARYAAAAEAELERILVVRGRAVSRIYADSAERLRIYRTGFPAREANRLDRVVPEIVSHLRTGNNFQEWDRPARFAYIRRAVEILGSLRRFAVPETVGSSKVTWAEVLQWWLSRPDAVRKPTVAQVATWHQFIAKHFTYRFNWALSAILASVQTSASATSGTVDIWAAGDLPWAAWWLKDLMIWGTLDPVAAYLLARGGLDVRTDAEAQATEYWRLDGEANEDPLNPALVREWVAARTDTRAERRTAVLTRFTATPSGRFDRAQADEAWRVLPLMFNGELAWVDPAGVVLATSAVPSDWRAETASQLDFELRPTERVVIARPYV